MTVAELGRRMSSAEFDDWLVYARLEPFGPLADGATAAYLANIHSDPKKRNGPVTAADALHTFAFDPPEAPGPVDLAAKFKAVMGQLTGGRKRTVKRKAR